MQQRRLRRPRLAPVATMVEEHPQEQERVIEEIVNPRTSSPPPIILEDVSPPPPPPVYDINRLPHDLGERLPIESYPVNDQDAIRRAYILRVHFILMHIFFQKEKLEKEIANSILYGFTSMIGLNIASRRTPNFALYATCSGRAMGHIHLL
jgi:hypothetical protein